MTDVATHRPWLSDLWEDFGRWYFAFASKAEALPELLAEVPISLILAEMGRRGERARIARRCAEVIAVAPDTELFSSDPAELMMAARIIEVEQISLPENLVDYLLHIRDALASGAVKPWHSPILYLTLQSHGSSASVAPMALPLENYLSQFGQVLGDIEFRTAFGTRIATIPDADRALLYAAASRALAFGNLSDGARALRCLRYVAIGAVDDRRTDVLLDMICARQESAGDFGPVGGARVAQLKRACACIWAIAEQTSDFRLFHAIGASPVLGSNATLS